MGQEGGDCGCKVPSRGAVEKKEEEGGKDATMTTTTAAGVTDGSKGVRDDMVFVEGKRSKKCAGMQKRRRKRRGKKPFYFFRPA
jgi:hypothetical protein